jgi:hypothetical protein
VDTPLINGRRFSFVNIETTIITPDGVAEIFIDYDAIEYSEELEIAFVQGTSIAPIGWTDGTYVPGDATLGLGKSSFQKLIKKIGDGWLGANLNLVVKYANTGEDPITDELITRIVGTSFSGSYGADALRETLKCKPIKIKRNGIVPILGMT